MSYHDQKDIASFLCLVQKKLPVKCNNLTKLTTARTYWLSKLSGECPQLLTLLPTCCNNPIGFVLTSYAEDVITNQGENTLNLKGSRAKLVTDRVSRSKYIFEIATVCVTVIPNIFHVSPILVQWNWPDRLITTGHGEVCPAVLGSFPMKYGFKESVMGC